MFISFLSLHCSEASAGSRQTRETVKVKLMQSERKEKREEDKSKLTATHRSFR